MQGTLFIGLLISSSTFVGVASDEGAQCEGDSCLIPEGGSILLQSQRDTAKKAVEHYELIHAAAGKAKDKATIDPDDEDGASDSDEPDAEDGIYNELSIAFPIALINLSNFSGLITTKDVPHLPDVPHKFGVDSDADLRLLFSKVEGIYQILHELQNVSDLCPFNEFSKLRRCLGIAMCVLQKATPHVVPLSVYTLYVELFARFDSITWELIEEAMDQEGAIQELQDYVVPEALVCDFTDHPGELELLQSEDAHSESAGLSATLAVAASLQRAFESSHNIFDSHFANESMSNTVQKLGHAWLPVCESLGCDHTNYWDLLAASHGHSLTMLEMNAPPRYIHSQIRGRILLENRVQHFLGAHGDDFAGRAYRHEDVQPVHHESMNNYFQKSRTALKHHTSAFVNSHDGESIDRVTRLVDGDRLEAFLNKLDESQNEESAASGFVGLESSRENSSVADEAVSTAADGALTDTQTDLEFEARPEATRVWRRRRRTRRRGNSCRRRFWKKAGCAISAAVQAVGSFLSDLFECLGQTKTLVATGYCKKFPGPSSNMGVGVGFTMSGGNLQTILSGNPQPSIALSISVVFGAVPGTPLTGGVRVGLGIGGSVACSGSGCVVGISVGAATSAIWPTTGVDCNFGSQILSFKCMRAAGLSVSILCCNFNVIDGTENCR